jgi:nitrate reductase gamma subunit
MAEYTLYISIFISIMGVLFQLYQFRKSGQFLGKGRVEKGQVGKNRVNSSFFPGTLSRVKNFIFHTFLQTKLFKAGKIRWTFHFLLFTGFLYLVFVHALHQVTSSYLFDNYEPTLDPYQFLRNLTGLLVLIACVSFLIRRGFNSELIPEKKVTHRGIFSIVLILGLVGTGFLLEASKIVSEPVFMEMVDQYSDLGEDPELVDLKLFWQHHYNLVFAEAIMARTTITSINENLRASWFVRRFMDDTSLKCGWSL